MNETGRYIDNTLLEMRGVEKARGGSGGPVFRIASLSLGRRESIVLTGRSGTGKTTLLHLIAGLLSADAGSIVVDGRAVSDMSESERDTFRAQTIGCVFQTLHLLHGFTALENVLLAAAFAGKKQGSSERARELLVRLGLERKLHTRSHRLSVGEQQRVAIARALLNAPALLLADEPTASLDDENARVVVEELRRLASDNGASLLIATHDPVVAESFDRVVPLADIVAVEHGKAQ